MVDTAQGESAWIVKEYISGRSQRDIREELGCAASMLSTTIRKFCKRWTDIDVAYARLYDNDRRAIAITALRNWSLSGSPADRKRVVVRPMSAKINLEMGKARAEHAWLLRAEGLTLQQVGGHLGVSREQARQLICKFSRRAARATRRTKFYVING